MLPGDSHRNRGARQVYKPLPGTHRPDTARESTKTRSMGSVPKELLSRPWDGCQTKSLPLWQQFQDKQTGLFLGRLGLCLSRLTVLRAKTVSPRVAVPWGHHGQAIKGHFLGGSHTWIPECQYLPKGILCMCLVPRLLSGGHQEDSAYLPRSLKRTTVDLWMCV